VGGPTVGARAGKDARVDKTKGWSIMEPQPIIPVLYHVYKPPALQPRQRVWCYVCDCLAVVTDWSDAPIIWPRGRALHRKSGVPGVIVEDELARAVKQESANAIAYWWGVSMFSVIKWRKALGVDRRNNEGTQILIHAATTRARAVAEQNGPTEQYRQKKREHMLRMRLWEKAPRVTHGLPWTPEHLAMLGTMPDREVALQTGHPLFSVKTTRQQLRIPGWKLRCR
jgi:hypothetical protein